MMQRIFLVMLNALLCTMLMVSYASATELTPQWAGSLYVYPMWSYIEVNNAAYFQVWLYYYYNEIAYQTIRFKVIEGVNYGSTGLVLTDEQGYATFSYTGTTLGYDRLVVWHDVDDSGTWDWLTEPADFAYVIWHDEYNWPYPPYYLEAYSSWAIIGYPVYLVVWLYSSEYGYVEDALIRFDVFDGPNMGVIGSDRTNEWGYAEFQYTGTIPGVDDVLVWYDINEDGNWNFESEPGEFVQVYWEVPYFWVYPDHASPPIGNEIYIQAEVYWWWYEYGPSISLTFEVVSGPNAGLTKTVVTDDAGIASFSYTGNSVGVDKVRVYVTDWPEYSEQFVYIYWMERLKFVKYELVSSEWKKPFYTAKLNAFIMNPTNVPEGCSPLDFTAYCVTAKIADSPTWTEVIQDEISFEGAYSIPPGETVMSDSSFSIKTDTSKVKDPKKGVVWCVMYYDPWWNLHVIADVPQLSK